ncbi:MAG: hypothetical protein M5U28_47785 [Sandaracinaceae bacterium]|nr:hypothetical protein [Sandaracinaceae bacterium]
MRNGLRRAGRLRDLRDGHLRGLELRLRLRGLRRRSRERLREADHDPDRLRELRHGLRPLQRQRGCSTGECRLVACAAGYENCDSNPANGCETNIRTLTNCGGCSLVCDLANASESCATGACALGTCNMGYGNCDGMTDNGCETSLTTLTHCGGCGVACDLARATESCATGTCSITACDAGYGNCDGTTSNGCETPLTTLTDCGACGSSCNLANATESCATGTCAITMCSPLFANCDGTASNGCERPTNTLTDCGGCGTVCDLAHASESCSTGTCSLGTCDAGWGNCDGAGANGCERPLTTLTDCGSCGVACNLANASESCATGSCLLDTCDALYANCDGSNGNGCERPHQHADRLRRLRRAVRRPERGRELQHRHLHDGRLRGGLRELRRPRLERL